jgi:hypothetical protein
MINTIGVFDKCIDHTICALMSKSTNNYNVWLLIYTYILEKNIARERELYLRPPPPQKIVSRQFGFVILLKRDFRSGT